MWSGRSEPFSDIGRSVALTFAVDLADEGISAVLDNPVHRGGLDGIAVTASYHSAKDLLVHNPIRRIFFHESGVVYFRPDDALYASTPLRPVQAALATKRDLVQETVHAAAARGMRSWAWVVFLHNSRLGLQHPELCIETAYGDRLVHSLCPSQRSVQRYCVALATDVTRRHPDAVYLEALAFMPFDHGWHHERIATVLDRWDRFLLGLCFCTACLNVARDADVDTERLRWLVRRELDTRLSTEDASAATELGGPDHPMLAPFLATRRLTVTRLIADVAAAIHREHSATHVVLLDDSGASAAASPDIRAVDVAAMHGLDIAGLGGVVNGVAVCAYFADAARVALEVGRYRDQIDTDVPLQVIVRPYAPDNSSAGALTETLAVAQRSGASSYAFYNYGQMPLYALDWVAEALRAV